MELQKQMTEMGRLASEAGFTAAQAIENFCEAAKIDITEVAEFRNKVNSTAYNQACDIMDGVEKVFSDNTIICEPNDIKAVSIFTVGEIDKALTQYGQDSMELQNMDNEFRFWDKVRDKIKAYERD